MRARRYTPADYHVVSSLAASRHLLITERHLPKNGVIITKEGRDILAAFCYPMSEMVWGIDWIISDPDLRMTRPVIQVMSEELSSIARENGAERILGFSGVKLFDEIGTSLGYQTAKGYTYYQKELI